MKAVEEPAYLSVGTDVSAKYRGAFCEAKIKTVKRLVKVKVTLKGESTSQVIHDDQVKGPLRVGSTVEVKTSEGSSSEAVISKLTDASLYTVVFDDGDEKTLRRTSLCLKGERHFAESETLDQLPLTNPEHFGTPVIGKKSNRGRRSSQAVADEENESSSSEEEDDDRRVSDELLGKVCSVEGQGEPSLVLVVSPLCNEELMVKKDHCLVRAFGDGKFSTVLRRHLSVLTCVGKPELCNRTGAEEAQVFLSSRTVPEVWRMDLSQILESSSDDEEERESEEEQEDDQDDKKKLIRDEPEEEADPEERDHFLQQLYKFMEDRGTPINKPPVLGYKDLNLFKLFRLVHSQGGCNGIESGTVWKQIYMDLGIAVLNSAAAYNVKTAYKKYLFGFEEYCRSALITFRTIHHNNPRPPTSPANQRAALEKQDQSSANQKAASEKQGLSSANERTSTETASPANHRASLEVKNSPVSNEKAASELKEPIKTETDSDSDGDRDQEDVKDRQASPRGRRRCVLPLKDKRSTDSEEQKDTRKRTPRQTELPERGRTAQSERGSEDEEDEGEEEDEEHNMVERCEEDPDGDSVTGTKVRVKYGRGKTQKIYEAHIKKTDLDNGETIYLVHYYGWNVRYDEWVKADRIIWPQEKSSKKKQKRKLKNKEEWEEERPVRGPGSGRRGRPLGSKNKTNGRRESGPTLFNGDNTPRRRSRRTSGMYDSDRPSNEDSGNSSDDSESEDTAEKKPPLWQRSPQQEEESPKQEVEEDQSESSVNTPESVPETTATAETIAPSLPQDTAPSQSEQRAEPEQQQLQNTPEQVRGLQQDTPEQKDPLPDPLSAPPAPAPSAPAPSATPPPRSTVPPPRSPPQSKLKLLTSVVPLVPRLPPRSEPMVLLHHCVPPDSDTDSASENDPETEEESPPLKDKTHGEKQLKTDKNHEEKLKTDTNHGEKLKTDTNHGEKLKTDTNQGERQMKTDTNQREKSPKTDKNQGEKSPKADKNQGEKGLKTQDKTIGDKLLKPDKAEAVSSPLKQNEAEKCLKSDKNDNETSVKDQKNGVNTPPQKPEKPTVEKSLKQAELSTEKEIKMDKNEGEKTSLKRKALEQRTPEKKLKTEEELSTKTTNMTTVEQSNTVEEDDDGVKMEDSATKEQSSVEDVAEEEVLPGGVEEEMLPEMGAEALVCHEVDLDDDEKERAVTASEQLMLMRESHPATPTHVKTTPTAAVGGFNCSEETEQGAKEPTLGNMGAGSEEVNSSPASNSSNCDRGQKRLLEGHHSPTGKKHKRHSSHKRPTPHKDKNGAGHSSDSEDQARVSVKPHKHCPSPSRGHKWTLHIDDLEKMSSSERISFLQEKLQEIRKYYLSLKSEVASIDRRRKRLKKKEREVSNTASASSSSDAGMSPSSSSPSQSSLAVEVR